MVWIAMKYAGAYLLGVLSMIQIIHLIVRSDEQ